MRGRVFGVRHFVYITISIGILLGGFLAEMFTVSEATFISGVAMMIFVLLSILISPLKRLDES